MCCSQRFKIHHGNVLQTARSNAATSLTKRWNPLCLEHLTPLKRSKRLLGYTQHPPTKQQPHHTPTSRTTHQTHFMWREATYEASLSLLPCLSLPQPAVGCRSPACAAAKQTSKMSFARCSRATGHRKVGFSAGISNVKNMTIIIIHHPKICCDRQPKHVCMIAGPRGVAMLVWIYNLHKAWGMTDLEYANSRAAHVVLS